MKFRLPGFGIRESPYERPNQRWICGWSATGEPCRVGPDARGECRATFECDPLHKEGRWHCTRPPLYGGACQNGPLPAGGCSRPIPKCQPARSLRARRGQLVGWASAVTVGLLALALGTRDRDTLLSPGDLGFQHGRTESDASLVAFLRVPRRSTTPASSPATQATPSAAPTRTPVRAGPQDGTSASARCGDCHGARRGPLGALAAVFGAPWGAPQSQLCLRCHALGEHPLHAHSQPPATLVRVTARIAARPAGAPQRREWECATCHVEHMGRRFPIAFLDDRRCQSCHARKFESLASGHPEFSGYPYDRGQNIRFDHNKHKTEYFFKTRNNKEDRPFECRGCHVPDPSGRNMLVRSFEETCAACHAAQIADNDGLAFLTVPGFDPAVNGAKARIGEWPNHDESDLSPFQRLLLEGDEDGGAYLEDLKGIDLLDLGHSADDELRAIQAYAWGVKRLFADLARNGQAAIRTRLQKTLFGQRSGASVSEDLVGQLPPATIQAARRAWFPHLPDEIQGLQAGAPPEARPSEKAAEEPQGASPGLEPKKWLEAGGWYRRDADFTVRYRPTRHADAFLRAWIDVAAGLRQENHSANRILETLKPPTAPGRCLKCHIVAPAAAGPSILGAAEAASTGRKDEEKGPAVVRWTARRSDPHERAFTKFAHTTHFSVLRLKETCSSCHLLAADAPQRIAQSELMAKAAGDFVPIQKARCVACHVRRAAGDNCVLCHNYHVGVFGTARTAVAGSGEPLAALAAGARQR